MTDPYPPILNIEIDRQRLTTYLRTKWLLCWVVPLCLLGGMFGIGPIANLFDRAVPTWSELLLCATKCISIGVGIGLTIGLIGYLVFSHRCAARFADSLEVSVDGPYLQIRQSFFVQSDRKLHFRSIVDYATNQDSFMKRFGLSSLQMSTLAGTIVIPGVKDCLRVRDVLSDIDRLRENQ